MTLAIWVSAAALAASALTAAVIVRRQKHNPDQEPAGWSAGPILWSHNYSDGVIEQPDGSFEFPQAPKSMHYATRSTQLGELAKAEQIRIHYRITADPGVTFIGADGKPTATGPTPYFEVEGDDWVNDGGRWWGTFACPGQLAPGEHEIIAPFDANWSSVEHMSRADNPAAFDAAREKAIRIGFTFGSDTGYGHGVYASGPARFELLEFAVE